MHPALDVLPLTAREVRSQPLCSPKGRAHDVLFVESMHYVWLGIGNKLWWSLVPPCLGSGRSKTCGEDPCDDVVLRPEHGAVALSDQVPRTVLLLLWEVARKCTVPR